MTLRQLKALALIGQTGSFTHAAERLFITQSAVSALIRELEQEVGETLVVRGRQCHLTPAGERLQAAGARAHHELHRALEDIRGDSPALATPVRVGVGPLSAATLLPVAIQELQSSAVPVRVAIVDRPVRMLGDLLVRGEADMVVGALDRVMTQSSKFDVSLLLEDSLAVVFGAGQSPVGRGSVGWQHLAGQALILVGRSGGQWNSLLHDVLASDHGLKIGFEVQLISTALALVREGLGIAIVPSYVTQALPPSDFDVRGLDAGEARWRTYVAAPAQAKTDNPAIAGLIAAFERAANNYQSPDTTATTAPAGALKLRSAQS